ncbi:MAG: YIP1 family protein [Deltaproteobacteria bacterium]|nr:YIP1 family protein [Deltaproteobacteria bacterium]
MAADPVSTPRPFGPTGGPIVQRLWSALRLDGAFYRLVAADAGGTGPVGAFVCLIALLRESGVVYDLSQVERLWALALFVFALLAVVRWLVIGGAALAITRLAGAPTDYKTLLRTLGYADAPTIFVAFGAYLPDSLLQVADITLLAWTFAATVVALRAATGATRGRGVALAVPVFIVQVATFMLMHY